MITYKQHKLNIIKCVMQLALIVAFILLVSVRVVSYA